ncbi:MAG: DUF309 domain-containing protein [Myxococcota bacterium]
MERPLPPYAFVPTFWPHPVRDPQGHSHKNPLDYGLPPSEQDFRQHEGWQYVQRLLLNGFYWEAHEGLEHWWKQLPESDARRPYFQGLLHLAAAGVKARQGQPGGVHSHASKAEKRLEEADLRLNAEHQMRTSDPVFLGISLNMLRKEASRIALQSSRFHTESGAHLVLPVLALHWKVEG